MLNQSELQRVEKDQINEIESVLNHRNEKAKTFSFFFFCMLNFINCLLVTNTSTGSELSLE